MLPDDGADAPPDDGASSASQEREHGDRFAPALSQFRAFVEASHVDTHDDPEAWASIGSEDELWGSDVAASEDEDSAADAPIGAGALSPLQKVSDTSVEPPRDPRARRAAPGPAGSRRAAPPAPPPRPRADHLARHAALLRRAQRREPTDK
jgi:hypothetical protein